jgi:hypothetical protein
VNTLIVSDVLFVQNELIVRGEFGAARGCRITLTLDASLGGKQVRKRVGDREFRLQVPGNTAAIRTYWQAPTTNSL